MAHPDYSIVQAKLDRLVKEAAKSSAAPHAMVIVILPEGGGTGKADLLFAGRGVNSDVVAFTCRSLLEELAAKRAQVLTLCEHCDGLAARARQAAAILSERAGFTCDVH